MDIDKKTVLAAVIKELERQKQQQEEAFQTARQTAAEAPGAMQSHSDTTKFQMSLLADKIQESITQKEKTIHTLKTLLESFGEEHHETIRIGSLIAVQKQDGRHIYYFILPEAGGIEVHESDKAILTITSTTPLANALVGRRSGDRVRLQFAGGEEIVVLDVS